MKNLKLLLLSGISVLIFTGCTKNTYITHHYEVITNETCSEKVVEKEIFNNNEELSKRLKYKKLKNEKIKEFLESKKDLDRKENPLGIKDPNKMKLYKDSKSEIKEKIDNNY